MVMEFAPQGSLDNQLNKAAEDDMGMSKLVLMQSSHARESTPTLRLSCYKRIAKWGLAQACDYIIIKYIAKGGWAQA